MRKPESHSASQLDPIERFLSQNVSSENNGLAAFAARQVICFAASQMLATNEQTCFAMLDLDLLGIGLCSA